MRVVFLYNHAAPHQLPHTAPYAFELSRRYPELDVVLAGSSAAECELAERIGRHYPGHRCRYRELRQSPAWRLIDPLLSKFTFETKKKVLRTHLEFFRSADAIVSPELTCLRLRTIHGLRNTRLIWVPHGAGDRAAGFDRRIAEFHFVLLPGRKLLERMLRQGLVQNDNAVAIGYAKFEAIKALTPEQPRLFENDRPVVLYSPHFHNELSSWQPAGLRILDWFRQQDRYNLIFAPHVILFRRSMRHRARLPGRFRRAPNIHVDTGSSRSIDMTYTRAADIYLGDVSSQIYEFLHRPRPAIFVDAHGTDWRNDPNYACWHLGDVIEDIENDLPGALENAPRRWHEIYARRQREAFEYTFAQPAGRTVGEAGADAIARWLGVAGAPGFASV